MKHTIHLNESELKRIITESIKRILKEESKNHTYDDILDDEDFLLLAKAVSQELNTLDMDAIYEIVCRFLSVKDSNVNWGFGRKYWNVNTVNEIEDISYHIYDYLQSTGI